MDSVTVTGTHAATARMDIHEVARQLNSHLGRSLRSPAPPIVSCRSAGPSPTARHRGLRTRGDCSSPTGHGPTPRGRRASTFARSWFIGANPVLHEATPLTAIRNDRGEDLMLAVKVLLEDTPDT